MVIKPDNIEEKNFEIKNVAFTENGKIINSDFFNGLDVESAKKRILEEIEKINGRKQTSKLRDWGISRQRWGVNLCLEDGEILQPKKMNFQ